MEISERGLELIKNHEKLRLHAYLPTPDDVPTIGYGHTGPDVHLGDQIDEDQANEWLLEDLQAAEDCIAAHVEVDLTQGQFDALCSFIFNVGCGAFKGSTLCKLINAGNLDAAKQQFSRWNHQGSKVLAELTRRRAEEAALFAET